jgi:hypothetical protein
MEHINSWSIVMMMMMMDKNTNAIRKITEARLQGGREVGLEVNT